MSPAFTDTLHHVDDDGVRPFAVDNPCIALNGRPAAETHVSLLPKVNGADPPQASLISPVCLDLEEGHPSSTTKVNGLSAPCVTDATIETLIFDIGDVLFKWSSHTGTSISSKSLRRVLASSTWQDYERGFLSQDECYRLVADLLSVTPSEVDAAFTAARESLRSDERMLDLIRTLRTANPKLRVFAMSNISAPDYVVLRGKPADWSIFDGVFTSAAAGARKPDLAFYKHVIADTGCQPNATVFIDDKLENVISARSLGMRGIVFDSAESVSRQLKNLVGDAVLRGEAYLQANAGRLLSYTDTGVTIHENFAQILIFEITENPDIVQFLKYPRLSCFFQGGGELTTAEFPFDLDTTSLALDVVGDTDPDLLHSIMTEMMGYRNADGITEVYFDHSRARIDPVVCTNVLRLFYKHGRGHELSDTLEWVYGVLLHRAYVDGTRYYTTPEAFLYFVNRLLSLPAFKDECRPWRGTLTTCVKERMGMSGDCLALAMRVVVCTSCGLDANEDLGRLLNMQAEHGGWEGGWIYRYGTSGVQIANRGLSTAMAIKAIRDARALQATQAQLQVDDE